jgi:non-canonical purine NTP pyrophosphatase (RdgB/HAM1 family)
MLYYITGNKGKLESANRRLQPFGIELIQKKLDLTEPQSDIIEEISLSKVKQAYEKVKKPLIVNDSAWYITALNGFPGPYMAFINKWFKARDFLNLMKGKENREVILKEVVYYTDGAECKFFSYETKGTILKTIKGLGAASDMVISLQASGKSIAECKAEGINSSDNSNLWEEFGEWYKSYVG